MESPNNTSGKGPQNVQRIDHVAYVFYKENIPSVIETLSNAFGITDWDGPAEMEAFGILQAQSVSAGIEVLAPLDPSDGSQFSQHLREKGEGFFALIFGVADLRRSAEAATKKGIQFKRGPDGEWLLIDSMKNKHGGPAHASWANKLHRYDEYWLEPLFGQNFFLSQIELKE
ncbi:hypothetical protein H2204_002208 [Knufia peltigerae]|uniref:VOC domain-containing protein n=1 Tax=Knufia peltigerae TaxID=1002370 RepID=A0AA38YBW2_9EURO|nr:hypothetical protein H2204_002208 [Knufia peltigerae]